MKPAPVWPQINTDSGILTCAGSTHFEALNRAAQREGFCLDGIHAEEANATLAALLERRQPRPVLWGGGLISARCVGIEVNGETPFGVLLAPRRAMGPDFRYLFIGGLGEFGRIERLSLGLCRPTAKYLEISGRYESLPSLLGVARALALLDPLSSRSVDLQEQSIRSWMPMRGAATATEHYLAGLSLSVEQTDAPPPESRFREPDADDGLWATVSASYGCIAELVECLKTAGDRASQRGLDYSDAHGARLTIRVDVVGTLSPMFELLKSRNHSDVDDIQLSVGLAAEFPDLATPQGRLLNSGDV